MGSLFETVRQDNIPVHGILIALICLLFCYNPASAQNTNEHYLFPDFGNATVVYKSGQKENIDLNYNTVTEEMVFFRNDQFMALDLTGTIDSVFLNNTVFIPYKEFFFERHTARPVDLYVRHKHKLLNTGKSTGYGTSQTTAIDNYSTIISSGQIYDLNISGDFQLIAENSIYLKTENGFQKADNVRELSELFSIRKQELRRHIKSNNLDLKNIDDLRELIDFLQNKR